jgi:hypothetical protein
MRFLLSSGRRVRVDGVDREGLLLRLRAEEGDRRAHFLRSDPGPGENHALLLFLYFSPMQRFGEYFYIITNVLVRLF